jgi:signal transduction histidine kinase/anti-sigma regulatory factor (Ser/Thr protein kinase)
VKEEQISFSADSQLVAELGERLISTPELALIELIKNAYDADAKKVNVWLSEDPRRGPTLNIRDDGVGMNRDDFLSSWMKIASSHKLDRECSKIYARPLTGSKGVGRFAVRRIGDHLTLETSTGNGDGLRAEFPWAAFVAGQPIAATPIRYWTGVPGLEKGTWLRVSSLRDVSNTGMREGIGEDVLHLQTPFHAAPKQLETDRKLNDPGFKLFFCVPDPDLEQRPEADLTREILDCAAIALTVKVRDNAVSYSYMFRSKRPPVTYSYTIAGQNYVGAIDADIRFLPQRPRAFAGLKNHDGRKAAAWVRRNGGVKVFDRGFRVPPYGSPDDDWLKLSENVARRRRTWDSDITTALLPKPAQTPTEAEHPALHLPANHQVLGNAALHTHNPRHFDQKIRLQLLQPSMDRQGFVNNEGFRQLYSIIRAGMEILAYLDLGEQLRRKKEQRDIETSGLKQGIEAAMRDVSGNSDIPLRVRRELTAKLEQLSVSVDRTDAAQKEAAIAVETLGLLGVMAGFMTHEMTTMHREVSAMLSSLEGIRTEGRPRTEREHFAEALEKIRAARVALERHTDYVRRFASNVRTLPERAYRVQPAIREVIRQFEYFTKPRHIVVESDITPELLAPPIPMSVYSGVVLNLYTNALKAVLAKKEGTERKIKIVGVREENVHILRVLDSGVGIAPTLHDKIFEPLFSTTTEEGPLGPGMGMGLYIVRRVLESLAGEKKKGKGRIRVVEPPNGFVTAMEVRIPYV